MTDDELTALQQMVEDPEAAAQLIEDINEAEANHENAPLDVPIMRIGFEVRASDLPKIRAELHEYAAGGQ